MQNKDNILDYIPVQNCPWGTDDKGKVYLIKEKTKNKLLKKIISLLGRSQDFHIHLDELGTAAWLQADGQHSILAVSSLLKQALGEKIEPAETRLAQFFAMLAKDGFIRWKSE
ncbi:MAG: PqqD family peptide modification chaperone [Candidatus Aminicenantes bacterium]|nr:PqqD family peptide modification chaperone [Candidatus Aminicenantes bacterium]